MTKKEFASEEIKSFWTWISENKDYVGVQYNNNTQFWLYIGFDQATLNSFTNQYQHLLEEYGFDCTMTMTAITFDVTKMENGYGFTMDELWENRPTNIENTLGDMLY